jgi:hypothetical protein
MRRRCVLSLDRSLRVMQRRKPVSYFSLGQFFTSNGSAICSSLLDEPASLVARTSKPRAKQNFAVIKAQQTISKVFKSTHVVEAAMLPLKSFG